MLALTAQQISDLRTIVNEASLAIAITTMGHLPDPEVIEHLREAGYLTDEQALDLAGLAFDHGIITGREEHPQAYAQASLSVTWDELKVMNAPLSGAESRARQLARERAGQYCVGLGNTWDSVLNRVIIEADRNLANRTRATIRDATKTAIEKRKTKGQLRSDLSQATGDWSRDWDRIAATEMQQAHQEGVFEAVVAQHGEEELLAKVPEAGACKNCLRLYLEDGKPKVRPASWWAEQGTNVGLKVDEWNAALGTLHPHCRCQLLRVPAGWGFTDDGEMVPDPESHKSVSGDLQKGSYRGGPYIGPRGGKWADPQHTVSWKERTWRDDLAAVENRIRKSKIEHAAVWIDGQQVANLDGQSDYVEVPTPIVERMRSSGTTVFTHNHPRSGTLSADDVYLALSNNVAEMRVACRDGRTFVLRRPPGTRKWLGYRFEDVEATSLKNALEIVVARSTKRASARMDQYIRDKGGTPSRSDDPHFSQKVWDDYVRIEQTRSFNEFLAPSGAKIEEIPARPSTKHFAGQEPTRRKIHAGDGHALAAEGTVDLEAHRKIVKLGGEYETSPGKFAVVLPDASEPGRVRVQSFDADGFSGHRAYDTLDDLVRDTVPHRGAWKPASGAVDRLSQDPQWAAGMARALVVQALNTLGYHRSREDVELINRHVDQHGFKATAAALAGWRESDKELSGKVRAALSGMSKRDTEAAIAEAIGGVLQYDRDVGRKDGTERLISVDANGKVLTDRVVGEGHHGTEKDEAVAVVHSHPMAYSLSWNDIIILNRGARKDNLRTIIAASSGALHGDVTYRADVVGDPFSRQEWNEKIRPSLERAERRIAKQLREATGDASLRGGGPVMHRLWTWATGSKGPLHGRIVYRRDFTEHVEKAHRLHYRTEFAGLPIAIENRRGSYRQWKDPGSGEEGRTIMSVPYGYFSLPQADAVDGDKLDVFLGPDENSEMVYVVQQLRAPAFKTFDECKVMLGFASRSEAERAYLAHYDSPDFHGNIAEIPLDVFREKLLAGGYAGKKISKAFQSSGDIPGQAYDGYHDRGSVASGAWLMDPQKKRVNRIIQMTSLMDSMKEFVAYQRKNGVPKVVVDARNFGPPTDPLAPANPPVRDFQVAAATDNLREATVRRNRERLDEEAERRATASVSVLEMHKWHP